MKLYKLADKVGINEEAFDQIDAVVIDFLTELGYSPDDTDEAGDRIEDGKLRSALMQVMLRSSLFNVWLEKQLNPPMALSAFIKLDAFNLVPGATFLVPNGTDYEYWTVVSMVDHPNSEQIMVQCRRPDLQDGPVVTELKLFSYTDKINLVGLVRSPGDSDDNNWGQS